MKHFSRLVVTTSSIALFAGFTSGATCSWAAGPERDGGQLVSIAQDSPALLLHGSQGYLGVGLRDVDSDRATALKLKDATGAEIIYVDHDAPAGKAGLRVHDVILQMNGQAVQGVEQLRRMLHETPAGRAVTFVLSRDGQQQSLTVQLADRSTIEQNAWSQHLTAPDPDDDDTPVIALSGPSGHGFSGGNGFFGSFTISPSYVGLELDTLGSQLADYFGVKDGQGLLVKRVEENSPASAAGLKAGDVITKVNGQTMATMNEWGKTIRANRGKQVQVTFVRNRKEQTVSMQAGDAKRKGELELPGMELPGLGLPGVDVKPQMDAALAELDAQGKDFDSAHLLPEMQQSLQAAKNVDTQKLQQAMEQQRKQIEGQLRELQEKSQTFIWRAMD